MPGSRISNALTEITDPSKTYYPQAFPRNGYGLCSKLVMGCTNQIPSLTFYEYSGYVIAGWARPELTKGSTSIGVVYKRDKFGSLIRVHRIEGKLFENKEQAEQHGIELCKDWIDKQFRV
jgi:hypothetical protein